MELYQIDKRLRTYLKALSWYILVNITVNLAASFLMGAIFNQDNAIATGLLLWLFSFIALQTYIDKQLFPATSKPYRFIRVSTITLIVLILFLCEFDIREARSHTSCLANDPDNNPFHYFLSMTWKTIVLWELTAHVINRRTIGFSGTAGVA